jgi:DNA-binding response OmpR family regulator
LRSARFPQQDVARRWSVPADDRPRRTILVVEDDFEVRFALQEALMEVGHTVFHATDGAQALKALRAGPQPELIVLDLMMRPMNGRDFRREQLVDPALAGIPVLIVSAAPNLTREAELLDAEALHKPFALDELVDAVERACARPTRT